MQQRWKWLLALAVVLPALVGSIPAAYAGVPDATQSFYVPQYGSVTTPTEGLGAIQRLRGCPNEDGTQVLPNSIRLKVVVRASDGSPIANIPAGDVCLLFNGGTPAQGFTGAGGDSIIANFQFNQLNNCPDIRCVPADAPTDALGTTYITLLGHRAADPPGVAPPANDPGNRRKWGGYEGDIPVMVLGFKLQGRLTSGGAPGSFTAHIRNTDFQGGRTTTANQGEIVNTLDRNPVQATVGNPANPYVYNQDFDGNADVNFIDLNFITAHLTTVPHTCKAPNVD